MLVQVHILVVSIIVVQDVLYIMTTTSPLNASVDVYAFMSAMVTAYPIEMDGLLVTVIPMFEWWLTTTVATREVCKLVIARVMKVQSGTSG